MSARDASELSHLVFSQRSTPRLRRNRSHSHVCSEAKSRDFTAFQLTSRIIQNRNDSFTKLLWITEMARICSIALDYAPTVITWYCHLLLLFASNVFEANHANHSSISDSPIPPVTSSTSDLPLCTFTPPSLFHSLLKTYLFQKSYPPWFYFFLPDCLHKLLPGPFLLSYSVFVFIFLIFSFLCLA